MWWKLAFETGLLALEARQVMLLRAARLAQGGAAATSEVQRMLVKKAIVGANVAFSAAQGRVRRNVRRLSR